MGWIDDLLGKHIKGNGSLVPDRKTLTFLGINVGVADNPVTGETEVTISTFGLDPLAAHGGGGYPVSSGNAIARGTTFIRGTPANNDSVRFFGAGGGESTPNAFDNGRIINTTGAIIALFPLPSQHIYLNGADQGLGNPCAISPLATVTWTLDAALNAHVYG